MAITIGTDSYVTVAEAQAYFDKRIDTDSWTEAVNTDKEKALASATRIIDELRFIGSVVDADQLLAWPRNVPPFFDARKGLVVSIQPDEFPILLKNATYELAMHLLLNEGLLENTEQTFERIKVGPIEIEDHASDFKPVPIFPLRIKRTLYPLLRNGGSNAWFRAN